MVWLRFAAVQLVMLAATVLGWFLLIPFCLLQFWELEPQGSIKDDRSIDVWKWVWLNKIYGNPEDGVSGTQALINGTQPYLPTSNPKWRAYRWSALRNSCDNLKYVFACSSCPLKRGTIFGRPYKIGWQEENGYKVPVISWG
jgi:hypothetical protein